MNSGRTIFAQLMDLLPLAEFRRCVDRYDGDYKVKTFSCLDQFLCLAYAQLTYRESLRDIETCLRAHTRQLYHMGFRGGISRNNLAHANQQRDWRIYADFARVLIAQARGLYRDEPFGLELDQTVYAFDSTTIDLCLALFPWAQFRRHKSAVKLHTLLDLRGSIPTAIYLTGGQVNEPSTSSTAAISITDVCIGSPKRWLSSSPVPIRTCATVPAPGGESITPRGCVPIKPFASLAPGARSAIPNLCGASTMSMPRRACAWSFSPTTFTWRPCSSLSSTAPAGESSCFFAGSNSICVSEPSTEPPKTP